MSVGERALSISEDWAPIDLPGETKKTFQEDLQLYLGEAVYLAVTQSNFTIRKDPKGFRLCWKQMLHGSTTRYRALFLRDGSGSVELETKSDYANFTRTINRDILIPMLESHMEQYKSIQIAIKITDAVKDYFTHLRTNSIELKYSVCFSSGNGFQLNLETKFFTRVLYPNEFDPTLLPSLINVEGADTAEVTAKISAQGVLLLKFNKDLAIASRLFPLTVKIYTKAGLDERCCISEGLIGESNRTLEFDYDLENEQPWSIKSY